MWLCVPLVGTWAFPYRVNVQNITFFLLFVNQTLWSYSLYGDLQKMAEIILPAELGNLELMIRFVRNGAEKSSFSSKDMNRIQLAAEEVLVNIISYAYPDESGNIKITYNIEADKGLVIEFTDWGIPFDPLSLPEPDIEASIEDREIGGLGIYIMRSLMDEVDYRREVDRNILTVVKH